MTESDAASPRRLQFQATAANAAWSSGTSGGTAQVLVDGRPVADTLIMRERTGAYTVNLGVLPVGAHDVVIRARRDIEHLDADLTVHDARVDVSSGEQALIDRYAPILHGRDIAGTTAPGSVNNDAPLALVPDVVRNSDGSRSITYRVLFSNEDGGTPTRRLMRDWGRTADFEWVYKVNVDSSGRKIPGQEWYQGAGHRSIQLEHFHDVERPVLHVATGNNNFAPGPGRSQLTWSDAADMSHLGTRDGLVALIERPWAFHVALNELQREGKIGRGRGQVEPQRLLFLTESSKWPERITLELGNGSLVTAVIPASNRARSGSSAIELPADVDARQVLRVLNPPALAVVTSDGQHPRTVTGSA